MSIDGKPQSLSLPLVIRKWPFMRLQSVLLTLLSKSGAVEREPMMKREKKVLREK
jgi:hypothetical protein